MTHLGPSQNCGHYTAIGQAPNSNYYQFDDSSVRPLSLSAVLGTNAYIMFFEKDNTLEDSTAPTASTSNVVYGPQLSDSILNREKSPLKLTFYRNDERRPIILNTNSSDSSKSEMKPIILNSTLSKSMESSNSISEPWVVKQNGEVEKVMIGPKVANGSGDKTSYKLDDERKVSFTIKKQGTEECHIKPKISKTDIDNKAISCTSSKTIEKSVTMSKLVKPLKSPLEKLEEQMNKGDVVNHVQRNGNSKLVPYDSESSSDERSERLCDEPSRKPKPSRCESSQSLIVTTKAMHHAWTVSKEKSGPLLSPSLNGDTNKK